jgi:hypothetical protein
MLTLIKKANKAGSFRDELDVNAVPVQVVVQDAVGHITGTWYENLAAAHIDYPTLDPFNSTKEFTWSMRGKTPDGRTGLRFENYAAYRTMST